MLVIEKINPDKLFSDLKKMQAQCESCNKISCMSCESRRIILGHVKARHFGYTHKYQPCNTPKQMKYFLSWYRGKLKKYYRNKVWSAYLIEPPPSKRYPNDSISSVVRRQMTRPLSGGLVRPK